MLDPDAVIAGYATRKVRGRSFFSLHTHPGEFLLSTQKCFVASITKIVDVSQPQSRKSKMFRGLYFPPSVEMFRVPIFSEFR